MHILNKILKPIIGSEEEYKKKMYEIYGSGDYEIGAKLHIKENKRMLIIALIIFFSFTLVILIGNGGYGDAFVYDKEKNVISLRSDQLQGKTVELQAYVKGYEKQGIQNISLYINTEKHAEQNSSKSSGDITGSDMKTKLILAGRDAVDKKAGSTITLPKRLEGFGEIVWLEKKRNNVPLTLISFVLILFFVKKANEEKLIKEKKDTLKSVEESLPEFVNKLILLLEAGAFFTSAVYKIEDKHKTVLRKEKNYFMMQISKICDSSREQKKPLQGELMEFAVRTRKREFIRIAGIICDNTAKGTNLVEKLKIENTLLWNEKKRAIEEKGMLAESKMVMPLALLLIVLVVITVAPAMLEM